MIKRIQIDTSGKGYNSQQDRFYFEDGIMACLPNARTENKVNVITNGEHSPMIFNAHWARTGERGNGWSQEAFTMDRGSGRDQLVFPFFPQNAIRRLTPVECERLQGFPDGWTEGVSETQRYRMMGNAVTVNVITEIGKQILRGW